MYHILINRIHTHILQTVTLPYMPCKLYHIWTLQTNILQIVP